MRQAINLLKHQCPAAYVAAFQIAGVSYWAGGDVLQWLCVPRIMLKTLVVLRLTL